MNICMMGSIFPPDAGGPATYIPAMATALTQRGHRVIVVVLSDRLDHDDRVYPFPVVRIKRGRFLPLRIIMMVWTLFKLGRKADVFYDNSLPWEAYLANLLLGGKPTVQKVVGDGAWERAVRLKWTTDSFDDFQHVPQRPRARILRAWIAFLRKRADVILVPSQFLARTMEGWNIKPQRIKVIYNAIKSIEGVSSVEHPLTTGYTLVTVSRLVPWKHIDGIIRAVHRLDDTGLVIVGDGTERANLEATASSLGIADRVHFAGHRSLDDVHGLMQQCDAFVLNSSYEGLPHIVLEAMQLDVPIIATAAGGTPEVVQHEQTGLLVPVGDDDALTTAMQRMRDDADLRTRLAQAAHIFVDAQFSFEAMVDQTEALLASMVVPR